MIFICSLEEKQQPGIILLFVALSIKYVYIHLKQGERKRKRKEERHVDHSEIKNRFSFHFQSSIDQN
jgi:hypothetical protein